MVNAITLLAMPPTVAYPLIAMVGALNVPMVYSLIQQHLLVKMSRLMVASRRVRQAAKYAPMITSWWETNA